MTEGKRLMCDELVGPEPGTKKAYLQIAEYEEWEDRTEAAIMRAAEQGVGRGGSSLVGAQTLIIGDLKVYRLNDYEWIAARTLEEAVAWWSKETGIPEDDECMLDPDWWPHELGPKAMKAHAYRDDEDLDDEGDPTVRTFAEELERAIERRGNDRSPFFFAGTEW